ncbi:DUF4160 domain-containing protein [Indiicoccus explosivorum]|uniref:DUF4160 domain-containing protein n=1 Tax=Indiicoccus explosivorum TaxID=1917864 RepID=UPI0011860D74|nr:DUF4160 domain-containing protein [Indiicoccus explosivorum]
MPKVSEFAGMKIYHYYDDHDPPHFHVRGQDKTRIEIATGNYLNDDPSLPRSKERQLKKWLDLHRRELLVAWDQCRAGKAPNDIAPTTEGRQ